jgi:hypothetical protein
MLVLVNVINHEYRIKSSTNPDHFIFISNDGVRKLGDDFDIRTHTAHEERNIWIIEPAG